MIRKVLLGPLLAGAVVAPLHATDEPQQPDAISPEPETITVVSDVAKSGVPLSKAPQAVTVIDREQLDAQAVQSVEEALRYAIGVRAELAARNGYEEFTIRGFSQSRYQFKDGLALDPGYLQQQEAFGLEQVEVLKGPASVLYGQIAPGGLVNSVSKLPTRERHQRLELTTGSDALYAASLDLSGALDAGKHWLGRVNARFSDRDDPIDFVFAKRRFLAPSLTWAPSSQTTLTLLAVYQEDEYRRADGLPAQGTLAPNPNGRPRNSVFLGEPALRPLEQRQVQLGYLFEHRFSEAVAVRQKFRRLRYDTDGDLFFVSFRSNEDGNVTDFRTLDRFAFDYYQPKATVYSVDNQLELKADTGSVAHRLLVGTDYLHNRAISQGTLLDIGSIDLFEPVYGQTPITRGEVFFDSDNTLRELGLYAQYRATLNRQFVLVAGQRYSDAETDNEEFTGGGSRTRQRDYETTGNYALMWLAPGGFSPYVSYAESFRPQVGFDPLIGGGQPPPAQGEQWELGLKWNSADRRIEATAALFDLRETNIVANNPGAEPGADPSSILIDGVSSRGIELESRVQVLPALSVQLGYAYLDAEVEAGDFAGRTPENVARHSALLFGQLAGSAFDLPSANFNLGLRHVGERPSDLSTPNIELPDYTVLDAGARWQIGRYTLGVNAKNLLDKRYYSGTSFGTVSATEPRAIIGSLRVDL